MICRGLVMKQKCQHFGPYGSTFHVTGFAQRIDIIADESKCVLAAFFFNQCFEKMYIFW